MKVMKAVIVSVVVALAIVTIDVLRIFIGMASFTVFAMILVDTVRNLKKLKRESIKKKRR
ncbi:MAG TPA: hypothetical protein IAD22_01030 [Candidatus Limousia pullorum]|uniref:Uncharacterized protein n=1 Tax=Candidatus Limousia pullorum TaxID=2840860 RepID=A0A9D1LWV2_9FIRM|nr:hypothetical protein [Candidatus Limousia pullorum]